MQEALSITNPHISEARASQFESLSESFRWRVAGHKGVPLRANGADFEHGIPDCSFCFDMDDNLGHEPGKRPALGCSKELKRCVRAETGGTSEEVYIFRVRSSGFLLFELPSRAASGCLLFSLRQRRQS